MIEASELYAMISVLGGTVTRRLCSGSCSFPSSSFSVSRRHATSTGSYHRLISSSCSALLQVTMEQVDGLLAAGKAAFKQWAANHDENTRLP